MSITMRDSDTQQTKGNGRCNGVIWRDSQCVLEIQAYGSSMRVTRKGKEGDKEKTKQNKECTLGFGLQKPNGKADMIWRSIQRQKRRAKRTVHILLNDAGAPLFTPAFAGSC